MSEANTVAPGERETCPAIHPRANRRAAPAAKARNWGDNGQPVVTTGFGAATG
jgi:hypothetical protein